MGKDLDGLQVGALASPAISRAEAHPVPVGDSGKCRYSRALTTESTRATPAFTGAVLPSSAM